MRRHLRGRLRCLEMGSRAKDGRGHTADELRSGHPRTAVPRVTRESIELVQRGSARNRKRLAFGSGDGAVFGMPRSLCPLQCLECPTVCAHCSVWDAPQFVPTAVFGMPRNLCLLQCLGCLTICAHGSVWDAPQFVPAAVLGMPHNLCPLQC
jgi:hypothetical protein